VSEKLTLKKENGGIDVKGTITLIVMLSSFLVALTLLPELVSGDEKSNNYSLMQTIALFALSASLLPIFTSIQKKTKSPLIDLQLLKDTVLLPTNILIMTIGISMFIIYQSLPILIQSPQPLGFGGGPVESASVQIPLMIITLIVSVSSGFLISKIGNIKPTIIGCIISTAGFFLLFIYHSTEFTIAVELSVVAIGLSFAEIGAFNIVLVSTPLHLSGTSLGITMLLFLIGMSVGPAISGIYLESFKSSIKGIDGYYPSNFSYDMIFLTAVIISIFSIILSVLVTKKLSPKILQKNRY
jgi:hypothetical protein